MNSTISARLLPGLFAAAATMLASCSGGSGEKQGGDAPLSAIGDSKAHTGTQEKAIRRAWDAAEAGETTRQDARELLKKAAWSRASFWRVRVAALEELLEDQANLDDTRNMMRLMLPTETQWNVIDLISKTAAQNQWSDLTTALVRCWSRPVERPGDDERPERAALVAMHPGRPVEEVIFGVFAGEQGLAPAKRGPADDRDREQREAWELLRRLDKEGSTTRAILARSNDVDGEGGTLLETLRAGARDLAVVPSTSEELAWLSRLREPRFSTLWQEAASAVARLGDEQKQGLELRHVLGLRWASANRPQWLAAPRAELLSRLSATLEPRKSHTAKQSVTAGVRMPESLRTWESKMVWGDALLALIASELVTDPALALAVFRHADEDRADRSTEHGGVIDAAQSGGFSIRLFPPRPTQRFGDRRFVASIEMIEQGSDALFHYHLHCTDYRNSEYAGPSADDVAYAKSQGRSCIVFTFISSDTINADYYQGDGVTLDLGELQRGPAQ